MDLGRWGIKQISRISDRYQNFKEFLADVLEGERELLESEPGQLELVFQVRDDLTALLDARRLIKLKQAERIPIVFRALSPFFEAGFLLRPAQEDGADFVSLEMMFLFGKVFQPAAIERPKVELSLPEIRSDQVFKGRIGPVLRVFRMDGSNALSEASAFLFAPTQDMVFLLICNRPQPWQVGFIERTFETLRSYINAPSEGRGS